MAGLLDLPNELLIKIIDGITTRRVFTFNLDDFIIYNNNYEPSLVAVEHFLQLALVSRRLSAIAQEVMIREIWLNNSRTWYKLSLLVEFLFKRPGLAQKVSKVTLSQQEEAYPSNDHQRLELHLFKEYADKTLTLMGVDFTRTIKFSIHDLTTWARLLISLTPNLRKFCLRYEEEGYFMNGLTEYIDDSPFKPIGLDSIRDLDLQCLLDMGNPHRSLTEPKWLDLPQLQRLSITVPNSNAALDVGKKSDLGIIELELRVVCYASEYSDDRIEELSKFLSRCAKLKHLKVDIIAIDQRWRFDNANPDLNWRMESRNLVGVLKPTMSLNGRLDSFELGLEPYFPYAVDVLNQSTLPEQPLFPNARQISVPQAALLCCDGTKSEAQTLCRMLPPTVMTPIVRFVSRDVIRIYEYLLSRLNDFPCLSVFVVRRVGLSVYDCSSTGVYVRLRKLVSDRLPVRIEDEEFFQYAASTQHGYLSTYRAVIARLGRPSNSRAL